MQGLGFEVDWSWRLVNFLNGWGSRTWLARKPYLGETFALKQIMYLKENDCYYWAAHQGLKLDLLVMHKGKRLGYEFKFSEAPQITQSMRIAMQDLKLDSLTIVNPGPYDYPIEEKINVLGLEI